MDAPRILDQPAVVSKQRFSAVWERLPGRFSVLLVTMLLLFVLEPFFEAHRLAGVVLNVFVSGILIAGMYAVSQKKRNLLIACSLMLPALAGRWLSSFSPYTGLFLVSMVFAFVFFFFTTGVILSHVVRAQRVTADTISAALCAYLLIGLTWAIVYTVMEFLHPGSFVLPPRQHYSASEDWLLKFQFSRFVYYSFITLTSTGFGDIIPQADPARGVTVLEAIIGQFYIAVLISRLVGLYIVHSLEERRSSG